MKHISIIYLLVVFNFLAATEFIPKNIDTIKKDSLMPSKYEISDIRECDECENDYTNYGSECCDTAWIEYGINCDELESIYFWDCSGCSCPGDEPLIDQDSCEGEWVEDIEWASCNQLNPSMSNGVSYCNDPSTNTDQCYTYSCYGGSYGSWNTCCGGEDYEIDNSYCEETEILECSALNQVTCTNNVDCEWIQDMSYGSCSSLAWQVCENYPGCYVDSNPGWYDNSGPYCTGGTYQIDNSYCEEIVMSECSETNEIQCETNQNCQWVEDIEIGQCSQFDNSENSCINYPGECFWDEGITYASCDYPNSGSCNSVEGCYWDCSDYGWYCDCYGQQQIVDNVCIGQYEIDNSHCQEIEILECSGLDHGPCMSDEQCEWVGGQDGYCQDLIVSECDDIDEFNCTNNDSCYWVEEIEFGSCNGNSSAQCNGDENCDWINDVVYGNCSNLGSSSCDANPNCWGAYTNPGWYYGWYCAGGNYVISDNSYCSGGNYEVDSSYCEEVDYQLGDITNDSLINILDIIQIVNLILESEYSQVVDMNFDNSVNVLDIVIIVEIILGN